VIVIIPELLRPGVVGSLLWVWVGEVQLGLEELEIMADSGVLGACGWGPIMLHTINKNSMILHYRPLYHPSNMNMRTLLHICQYQSWKLVCLPILGTVYLISN
jgi:hypothetical protein